MYEDFLKGFAKANDGLSNLFGSRTKRLDACDAQDNKNK